MGEEKPIRVWITKHRGHRNWSMRYWDSVSQLPREKSTGTANKVQALKKAGEWEAALNAGAYCPPLQITWAEFREAYEAEKLAGLAPKTQQSASSALNHVERVLNPARLKSLTSRHLGEFLATLRRERMRETTIGSHLRHIKAALNWAVSAGLLLKAPAIHMPRRQKGARLMRGRPITVEEFERMLAAVAKVRPRDPGVWQRYLTGLWLSGLRLEESLALSWDGHEPLCIDLGGRHPRFRIYAEAEKGRRDRYLPMTPDFADWILQTPAEDRQGPVFRLEGLDTGRQVAANFICRVVGMIGRQAGVVTDKAQGRYATCHDLRRSFGTRWSKKVHPTTLQRLMRHASIGTTMGYYVDQDADELADELWAGHRLTLASGQPEPGYGGTYGGTSGAEGGDK